MQAFAGKARAQGACCQRGAYLAGSRAPAPLLRHGGCPRQQQTARYRPDTAPADAAATNGVYKPGSKDSQQQVQDMLIALRTLSDEASTLQNKLLSSLAGTPAASPAAASQAEFMVLPEHVASARAWIAAWRAKQHAVVVAAAADSNSAVEQPVASSSTTTTTTTSVMVPENVMSARAWIAAWRAKQPVNVVTAAALPAATTTAAAAGRDASTLASSKPTAGAPATRPAPAAAAPKKADGYTNTNRYWVPAKLAKRFLEVIADRKAEMQKYDGFVSKTVKQPEGSTDDAPLEGEYVVASKWASIPAWEAYSLGGVNQRHQIPTGIFQYVPGKGQGFPEDYLPFKDFAGEIPNAKY